MDTKVCFWAYTDIVLVSFLDDFMGSIGVLFYANP